jgi:hypothetical protein
MANGWALVLQVIRTQKPEVLTGGATEIRPSNVLNKLDEKAGAEMNQMANVSRV